MVNHLDSINQAAGALRYAGANHAGVDMVIAAHNGVLRLANVADRLSRYADTVELILTETHPGKWEALRDLVREAKGVLEEFGYTDPTEPPGGGGNG